MEQNQLINKRLSEFRRKFYVNKILRGSLILTVLTGAMLFVALLSEGLFGFSPSVRTGMVYSLGAVFVGILATMVIYPVSQLLSIAKTISDFQIADMVRKHFPDISDKLTNLLQLRRGLNTQNSLVMAAIDQKAGEIAPVRISNAINLNVNMRYVRYLALLLLLFIGVYLIDPNIIRNGGFHLFNYKQKFEKPAAFALEIDSLPTKMVAGETYNLKVKVKNARELPAELFIYLKKASESGFLDFNLKKESKTDFTFTISDVKDDFSFYVGNPEVRTEEYKVKVLKRPFIKSFKVTIQNPAYTGLGVQELEPNVGDFRALKGSTITWELEPQGEVAAAYFTGLGKETFNKGGEGKMIFRKMVITDMNYFLTLKSSENLENLDTVRYQINILQDRFPSIYVNSPNEYLVDLDPEMPLNVEIGDDYGFSKMSLFYRITKSGGNTATSENYSEYPLSIAPKTLIQPLTFNLNLLTQLGMKEGDELEYYVKVWDNDGITGPKSSTSGTFNVRYPTLNAKYEEVGKEQQDIKDEMKELKEQTEKIAEEYRKMQEKMLDQKRLSFDDKKEAQRILDEHKQAMDKMEQLQQRMQENKEKMQNNQMISEETLKKYEELNKLMQELNNPEIKKMLEDMQKKMEQLNPEEIKNKMEQLQMKDEELKKSIERTMELMKQLEVQQKVDEIKNKLDNLRAKQEMLNEKLNKAQTPEESKKLSEMQDELNKQMKDIEKDMKELGEKKEKTSTPDKDKMDELQKEAKDTEKEMEESSDDMQDAGQQQQSGEQQKAQESKKSASKKQKSASKKMQKMSQMLSEMQQKSQEQQDEKNLEHLRELLENLLKLSFDQEDLRNQVTALKYGDPALKDKSQQQKKLQDDMKLVRDSLQSLANQVSQIKQYVLDESAKITEAMKNTQTHFRNKQINMITFQEQLAMTSINNLANMLSDVMKQIQAQMKANQQGKPGQGMCQKPGNKPGGTSMKQLGQKQQQLNSMMQQMMQQGNMDGKKLAEMAAQQEAIRKQLKEMHEKTKAEGGKMLGDADKIMQDMVESETELIQKQLTEQTLMRQQQILSRLLQADKSVRERELDDKRESNTAKDLDKKAPEQLTQEEYKNKIRQELLKTSKMEYSGDYIQLIEEYFKRLDGGGNRNPNPNTNEKK